MKEKMRPYWSAFRLRALQETQYRAAALGGLVTNTFFGLILIFLYQALYAGQTPQELQNVITYVWLQQAFFRIMYSNDSELNQQIRTGSIAYDLIRPLDQQLWWSCRNLASRLVSGLMRMAPMFAIQLLLPADCRMALPASPIAFLQFLFSISLGVLCLTEIGSICDALNMITLDPRGISGMLNLAMAALSGNVIPLTLFPERFQALIRYQPFAQALDAPIRMYLAPQAAGEFALNILVQLMWLVLFTGTARRLWNSHLRRLVVQGG